LLTKLVRQRTNNIIVWRFGGSQLAPGEK